MFSLSQPTIKEKIDDMKVTTFRVLAFVALALMIAFGAMFVPADSAEAQSGSKLVEFAFYTDRNGYGVKDASESDSSDRASPPWSAGSKCNNYDFDPALGNDWKYIDVDALGSGPYYAAFISCQHSPVTGE